MKKISHKDRVKVFLTKSGMYHYGIAHSVVGTALEYGEDPAEAVRREYDNASPRRPELYYAIQESAVISSSALPFDHGGIELVDGETVLFNGTETVVKVKGDFSDMIEFIPVVSSQQEERQEEKQFDEESVGNVFAKVSTHRFMEVFSRYASLDTDLMEAREVHENCAPECIFGIVEKSVSSPADIVKMVEFLSGDPCKSVALTDFNSGSNDLGEVVITSDGDVVYMTGMVVLFTESQRVAVSQACRLFGSDAVSSVNLTFGVTLKLNK